ncbi:MAG: hypothetical protein HY980_01865 [Candidatus Magasanikbacteria bacterium]|nr:hypothetical protein [Candidatus Magasanikbacteria bacterium]
MSSLDRLIDLAQQTGDRLIVHDPIEGRDIVIMDVGEYEKLVFGKINRDSHTPAWHSAGSVLENRYGGQWDDDSGFDDTDEDEEEENNLGSFMGVDDSNEIKIEDIPFGPEQKTTPVPLAANSEEGDGWKEEPLLEEEPVFYEEPV